MSSATASDPTDAVTLRQQRLSPRSPAGGPTTGAPVAGEDRVAWLAELRLSRLHSRGTVVNKPTRGPDEKHPDHILVLFPRKGLFRLRQGGREAELRPGDFAIHDCVRPYELQCDGAMHELVVLRLQRAQLELQVGRLDDLTARTVSRDEGAARLLTSMVRTLCGGGVNLHPCTSLGVAEALTNVVGAGLRMLPGLSRQCGSHLTAYHLTRVRAYVQENLRDPSLSISSIAAALQMSPDHLGRLFRGQPAPLSRVIWQMRLDACRRELADPRLSGRSVSEIAFSWGFNDAAHFSRSFRDLHGTSPREWRLQHLQGLRRSAAAGAVETEGEGCVPTRA